MNEHAQSGWRRLPRRRLRPGGPDAGGAATWAARAGYAAAALGAGWLGLVVVSPLPTPNAEEAPRLPALPSLPREDASLEQRQRILASLTSENVFRPDRTFWTRAPTAPTADDATPPPSVASAEEPTSTDDAAPLAAESAGGTIDYDSIPIRALGQLSPAVNKKVRELILRGVYATQGEPVAMIGTVAEQATRGAAPRRVGDRFDDGAWRVLAIDAKRGRVILERTGEVNVELRLYPDDAYEPSWPRGEVAAADSGPEASGAVAEDEPADASARLEQIRRELESAGVDPEAIDETLTLAEETAREDEAEGVEGEAAVAARAEGGETKGEAEPAQRKRRRGPSGVGPLLKLLSTNPLRPQETGAGDDARESTDAQEDEAEGADAPASEGGSDTPEEDADGDSG